MADQADLEMRRETAQTVFVGRTSLQAGRYTMRLTVEEGSDAREIQGIFDVLNPGDAVGGITIESETLEAGPGETVYLTGGGYAAAQTVIIYAQLDERTEEEKQRYPACEQRDASDPTVTATADAAGLLTATGFALSDERFRQAADVNWHFCAEDGQGERTITPAVIGIVRVLQFENDTPTLRAGAENDVWITPRLSESSTISGWTVGPTRSTRAIAKAADGDRDRISVRPDLELGSYTLTVRTSEGILTAQVTIVADTPERGRWLETEPEAAGPGESVSITGGGFTAAQTVQIYALPAADEEIESPQCIARTNDHPTITATADAEGGIAATEFPLEDERFGTTAGAQWHICAVDGAGHMTEHPATITIQRILQFGNEAHEMTAGIGNSVWIAPKLDDDAAISGWTLGPRSNQDDVGTSTDGNRTLLSVTPQLPAGTYTLTVTAGEEQIAATVIVIEGPTAGSRWVAIEPQEAGPGESVTVTGGGFTANQTVQIYAQQDAENETEQTDACTTITAGDPTVTATASASGMVSATAFPLTNTRFNERAGARWRVCGVDGDGQISERGAALTIVRTLQFADERALLISGVDNDVWIAPPPDATDSVTGWSLGATTAEAPQEQQLDEGRYRFAIRPELPDGRYTLRVTVGDETLEAEVEVTSDTTLSGAAYVAGPTTAVRVGDTVEISGGNQAAGQSVRIYALPPGDERDCRSESLGEPVMSATAGPEGQFTGQLLIEESHFTKAGDWALCSAGGDGQISTAPGTLTLERTIVVANDEIVQLRQNEMRIAPPMPADSTLETAWLAGRVQTSATVTESTDDRTTVRLRTTTEPGNYTLTMLFNDGTSVSRQVTVVAQENPPTIAVGEEWQFGRETTISAAGFQPNSNLSLLMKRAEEGAPTNCGAMLEELTAGTTTVVRISQWGGEALTTDQTGASSATGKPDPLLIEALGDWLVCAEDGVGNATAEAVAVKVRPGLEVGDDEGRVRAGHDAEIRVIPAIAANTVVENLRLGKRTQQFTVGAGSILWTDVPELIGNHSLSIEINGEIASTDVTIISGRRPDQTIPNNAKECVGITTALDGARPGGRTAMEFTFRIDPTDGLECPTRPESEEEQPSESLIARAATTILPDDEITISLRPDYGLPTSSQAEIEIRSYANRFGHRYTTNAVRVRRSASANENHTLVIPPCTEWRDAQGDPAPCEIEHAQEMSVAVRGTFTLPTDAAQEYATQVAYGEKTIWDLLVMRTAISTEQLRVAFNEELKVTGVGFGNDETITMHGVNRSDERFSIPAEEETSDWDCRLITALGDEVGTAESEQDGTFEVEIDVEADAFDRPGHWSICATAGPASTSEEPVIVTIDYEAIANTARPYRSGATEYIRINPQPDADDQPTGMTVDGETVDIEMTGDRLHFKMPVNIDGTVDAVVEFADDIRATTTLNTARPALEAKSSEASGQVRIGTRVQLHAERVAGLRVCEITLGEVAVDIIEGGNRVECATMGANQQLKMAIRIAQQGEATQDLVKLFSENATAELKVKTDAEQELTATLSLLRPSITLSDEGERIRRNLLMQFKPVTVEGTGFPKDSGNFQAPRVGYHVEDQEGWDTVANDGQWKHRFQMQGDVEEGLVIEFVPTIAGHLMPELAVTLTLGVATPQLTVEPSEVSTGERITITATGLLGFVGGYWMTISEVGEDGTFVLTDHTNGEAFTATTDGEGNFEHTLSFPDWEAFNYDEAGKALIELQLHNTLGEAVPNAVVELTHVRPQRTPASGPRYSPTVTPLPTTPAGSIYVTREGPTPTPPIRPTITARPLPTRETNVGPGEDRSVPHPVDHATVTTRTAPDGAWIRLEWIPAGGSIPADGYRIERADQPGETPQPVKTPHRTSIPTYHDDDVEPGSTYWYYIIATNRNGEAEPAEGANVMVHTPGQPGQPTDVTAITIGATVVRIAWAAPQDIAGDRPRPLGGFAIQIRQEGEEWEEVTDVSAYIRQWVIVDLRHGNKYEIRVAANNEVGTGPWSDTLHVTTAGEPSIIPAGPVGAPTRPPEAPEGQPQPAEEGQPTATPPPIPQPTGLGADQTSRQWLMVISALAGALALAAALVIWNRRRKMALLQQAASEPPVVGTEEVEDGAHPGLPEPRMVEEEVDNIEEATLDELINQLRNLDEGQGGNSPEDRRDG